jgi:flagellar biosynthetic protein FlhB
MSEEQKKDDDQKTEEPTERQLEQAREKGQVPVSRELINLVLMGTSGIIILYISPYITRRLFNDILPFIAFPDQMNVEGSSLKRSLSHLVFSVLGLMAIPLGLLFTVVIGTGILQVGSSLSFETLTPKLSRLSIKNGLQKIFSKKALFEFIKTIFKTSILFVSIYLIFKDHFWEAPTWAGFSFHDVYSIFHSLLFKLFGALLLILTALSMVDYLYQRFQFRKDLRMTKQELKDEYKEAEGDPVIKQRLRKLRNERIRKRMMATIPEATVIITNPTHYSVALKWISKEMNAPVVVAKGKDLIALKIREIAQEHAIPIIENPPVARALFDSVEIDQEIPSEYYKAVADIIRLVMKLKARRF